MSTRNLSWDNCYIEYRIIQHFFRCENNFEPFELVSFKVFDIYFPVPYSLNVFLLFFFIQNRKKSRLKSIQLKQIDEKQSLYHYVFIQKKTILFLQNNL